MRRLKTSHRIAWVLIAVLAAGVAAQASSTPPELFSEPFHQSPVRAEPDDLLMIAGSGFDTSLDSKRGFKVYVVYQRVTNTTIQPSPPMGVPARSTALQGVAETVAVTDNAVTVRIPRQCGGMLLGGCWTTGQSYVLWVANDRYPGPGQWSTPLLINDARPLWMSPSVAYVTESHDFCEGDASCDRYLKIVGRNLQPAPGQVTRVRLRPYFEGPTVPVAPWYEVTAEVSSDTLDEYVAKVELPPTLYCETPPCRYTISVARDGQSWVTLEDQKLEVVANPGIRSAYAVSSGVCTNHPDPTCTAATCGVCQAGDEVDDTKCIECTIALAADDPYLSQSGAAVSFSSGVYTVDLIWNETGDPYWADSPVFDLPAGVSLIGQGPNSTTLDVIRDADLDYATGKNAPPVFMLHGNQAVTGINFTDAFGTHADADDVLYGSCNEGHFLQLGERGDCGGVNEPACPANPEPVVDVTMSNNRFQGMRTGIGAGGLSPNQRIYITNNELGAFKRSLSLTGCNTQAGRPLFVFEDSIIAGNLFVPGLFLAEPNGNGVVDQGAIGSVLGSGRRLDFSSNDASPADGVTWPCRATGDGGCGFRAAHFWYINGAEEMLLVSENVGPCMGTRTGDGEFMAFDQPGFNPAFFGLRATVNDGGLLNGNYVTIDELSGFPAHLGRPIWDIDPADIGDGSTGNDPRFFTNDNGFWLAVVNGKGMGQARRIESYSLWNGEWEIYVTPDWDVRPDTTSQVMAQRMYHQLYVVDNATDNAYCEDSNPTNPEAGIIGAFGPTIDSVIAGNSQTYADGLLTAAIATMRLAGQCDGVDEYGNHPQCYPKKYEWEDPCADLQEPEGGQCVTSSCDTCVTSSCDGELDNICTDDDDCTGVGETCSLIQPYSWSVARYGRFRKQAMNVQYFNVIHDNLVDNEVDFTEETEPPEGWSGCNDSHHCSPSGIRLDYAAPFKRNDDDTAWEADYTDLPEPFPFLSFGLSINRNEVIRADAIRGGAIAVEQTGSSIPNSANGASLHENLLIHNNTIRDVFRVFVDTENDECVWPLPKPLGGVLDGGTGIHISTSRATNAVLFKNHVENTPHPIVLPALGDTTVLVPYTPNVCPGEETWCFDPQPDDPSCTYLITGMSECERTDGSLFACAEGEHVYLRNCPCTGSPYCTDETRLVCE